MERKRNERSFTVEHRKLDWSKGKNLDRYITESRHKHAHPCVCRDPLTNHTRGDRECLTSPVYKWVR